MAVKDQITHSLDPDELLHYRDEGYLVRPGVFSEAELLLLCDAVEQAVELAFHQTHNGRTYYLDNKRFVDVDTMTVQFEHSQDSDTVRVIEPAHHLHPRLNELVGDSRIVDPIRSILDTTDVSIWTNKLNLKRAGEGSGFGWHQDSPYWVHDSDHVDLLPNVYLAIDPATRANGCLRMIRCSHLQGCLPGTSDGSALGGFFTDPSCFDSRDEVLFEVEAGSLVFFDPHTIHGSEPNLTDQSRRAMVMTYQPAGFPMLKTGRVVNL